MNANLRVMVIFMACGLAACTTQEARPDSGSPGTGGGAAGTSGGGSTGTGGSYALSDGVTCPPVTMALITDFTYNPDGGVMDQVPFGDATTTFSGGQYIYPTSGMYPLVSNMTGNNWHMTGMVGDYSGFGLYFTNCSVANATGYRGISFSISGTVQGGAVTFEVDTRGDTIAPSWIMAHPAPDDTMVKVTDPGHCVPTGNPVNKYAQTDCVQPTKMVTVTASAVTQTVLWSDFTSGKPDAAPKPAEIVGIRWILPQPAGVGSGSVTTYPLDLVVDDLKFVQ